MWESGKSSARGAERSLFSPLMLPAGRQAHPTTDPKVLAPQNIKLKKAAVSNWSTWPHMTPAGDRD